MGSQQIILSASKNSQVCLRARFQHGLWRERGSRDKSGMEAAWMVAVLWAIFSCPCPEQGPEILFFAFLFGQLSLPPLPSFPNIEKYINKFPVAWWTSGWNMQIMSLQLQKSFRFFPLSFFPSQFTPNCNLLTKAASLGKAPILFLYIRKKSNSSSLYASPIPPPTWSHAHNALLVCLNHTWGLPACCATVTLETALSILQYLSVPGHLCWVASVAHFKIMF